jgi:hypothetical protein
MSPGDTMPPCFGHPARCRPAHRSDPERLTKVCAGTERNGCLFTTTALGLVGATGAPAIF